MKVFLIICAIIATAILLFLLQTKNSARDITDNMSNKKYAYYCVANSQNVQNDGNQQTVTINNNKINLGDLWGSSRMSADGSYAVIFTNDLTNAIEINIANREMVKNLSDNKIPYCAKIAK